MADRDIMEERTFVNLKPIAARFVQEIRKFAMDNIQNFEKQAERNVEDAKATLLDLMDQIDERVLEIQRQMINAQFDQKEKQILVAENEKKVEWCNRFMDELQQILAI
jgi:transcriptional regulator